MKNWLFGSLIVLRGDFETSEFSGVIFLSIVGSPPLDMRGGIYSVDTISLMVGFEDTTLIVIP